MAVKLTLGPVLFNWTPEKWRDFYFKIADEAAVDIIYIGEVTCSKRAPFFAPIFPEVIERLQKAKKEIVISSLAMVMNKREAAAMRELCEDRSLMIEANDVSALPNLAEHDHVIGPYINVYNEDTLHHLSRQGARRICLSPEIPIGAAKILAAEGKKYQTAIEVQIFGRMPLALSARCYHARAHNLSKDNCQFVCGKDPDGLTLRTLDDQPFLAINGIQTLSDSYIDLGDQLAEMVKSGISHFRLSPQDCDMTEIARHYKGRLKGINTSKTIENILPHIRFSNSYYHASKKA